MQVLESPPLSLSGSLGTSSVILNSRGLQIFARSVTLGELEFFGGPGLQSLELRLPEVESIGDKATVFADTLDSNGNILEIAFTFERVGDNVIRASAGRPGTVDAFISVFDIYLGDGGIILGFDTDLDGRIDTVTAPTLTVPSAVFGVSPLKVQLTILSFGGNGGAREEEAVSFLTSPLSLGTLLTAQEGADTSSASTTTSTTASTTDSGTSATGTTDTGTGGNGPSDFALQQGRKNGF